VNLRRNQKSRLWRDLRFLDTISFIFFLCVESGRTHKDIRLELAPLSALGRKYFLNQNNILKVIHIFSFYLLYMLSFSR